MKKLRHFRITLLLPLALTTLGPAFLAAQVAEQEKAQILVFSKTDGFRHGSIEPGIEAIRQLGEQHGFGVQATEDAERFSRENLGQFQAVVFLNTTRTILNDRQREAFQDYIRQGGGFVGVHAAADTEYEWEWYGRLVGAYFKSHPRTQPAVIQVEDRQHPSTRHLPDRWERTDEWYNFRTNPRENVEVLLSLDPDSFNGSEMDGDHPIAWYHEFEGGRAFYTGLGHTPQSYQEEAFLAHLLGGIRWAAGIYDAEKPEVAQ